MKVLLITQDEPIFIGPAIDYLLRRLSPHVKVTGICVLENSPFGKKLNVFKKIMTTIKVFGFKFFLQAGIQNFLGRIKGRSVANIANKHMVQLLPVIGSINSLENIKLLSEHKADIFVSIAGNQVFKRQLLDVPKLGVLNIHTSRLPDYRGLMPTFWVLKNQELETSVSIFFVDEGIDSGPILVQKHIKLGAISQWDLIRYTKFLGMEALAESLDLVHKGTYKLLKNDVEIGSYYSFPTHSDVKDFRLKGQSFF